MNFIIPMAGLGTRFSDAGFLLPKWLIRAKGKTLLQWAIDSLPIHLGKKIIFIALKADAEKYGLSKLVRELYGSKIDLEFIFLNNHTDGQAETVFHAKSYVKPSEPIGIFNIDTKFTSNTLEKFLLQPDIDGVLGAFFSTSPKFSYARLDENGYVVQTTEKNVISNFALTGFYGFSKSEDFFTTIGERISRNEKDKGEYYIAPLYNDLLQRGKRYIIDVASDVDILGTPQELDDFIAKENI